MQLLMVLALAGIVSGSLSGALWSGGDGLALGGATGLVAGVLIWWLTGVARGTLREVRLNRHFLNPDLLPHDLTDRRE